MKILVDFDDTIMETGTEEPIPKAISSIKAMQNMGDEVVIFTSNPDLDYVSKWLNDKGLDLKVTDKKEHADVYIDNKAIPFKGDWIEVLNHLDGFGGDDKEESEKNETTKETEEEQPKEQEEKSRTLGVLEKPKKQLGILNTVPMVSSSKDENTKSITVSTI